MNKENKSGNVQLYKYVHKPDRSVCTINSKVANLLIKLLYNVKIEKKLVDFTLLSTKN